MKIKKGFISALVFLAMIQFGYSQRTIACYINFESPMASSCIEDTLLIDTINNVNNVWEIGPPNKTTFQSAASVPNAIVTKLADPYPTNDTSSFIIIHQADAALNDFGEMWVDALFKIDSDTLTDYGTIEFSPDNGLLWINLLTDTIYSQQNMYQWTSNKPVLSGSSSDWLPISFRITDNSHFFNIHYGDTILLRFTFISDNIQTFKDGWMLDEISINDWYENISETTLPKSMIKVYPNPFSLHTIIKTDNILKNATLTIYNSLGQQVRELNNITGQSINFSRDNLSKGLYFIRLKENNKIIATDKLEITD